MNSLMVLPNFKIIVLNPAEDTVKNTIKNYTDLVTSNSQSDTYVLSSTSYWRGLNKGLKDDFITLIKSVEVPPNVLNELDTWHKKFGLIILVNNDCVNINNPNLQQEILNHSLLKNNIYNTQGSLIFFKNISLDEIKDIFENELNYPIKIHRPIELENIPETINETIESFDLKKTEIKDKQMDLLFKSILPIIGRL